MITGKELDESLREWRQALIECIRDEMMLARIKDGCTP